MAQAKAAREKAVKEDSMAKAEHFLSALTELSRSHGVGIAGHPVLFLMESDDFDRSYRIDNESNLAFN